MNNVGIVLAVASCLCFGLAYVPAKIGLRSCSARAGAAISIPTATAIFLIAAPFALDVSGFRLGAALIFAAVGLFFPALVTLITFRSNAAFGPTVTSAFSGTAPIFAMLAGWALLGEHLTAPVGLAALGVLLGLALATRTPATNRHGLSPALVWPVAGAVLRGLAQVAAKLGLLLWPNPFAASLIGYAISTVVIVGVERLALKRAAGVPKRAIGWFVATGALNGLAVLAMYSALSVAPLVIVAPIVAAYPVITLISSFIFLRDTTLSRRVVAGAALAVGSIIYLAIAGPST